MGSNAEFFGVETNEDVILWGLMQKVLV
jgi:hypothetical protein